MLDVKPAYSFLETISSSLKLADLVFDPASLLLSYHLSRSPITAVAVLPILPHFLLVPVITAVGRGRAGGVGDDDNEEDDDDTNAVFGINVLMNLVVEIIIVLIHMVNCFHHHQKQRHHHRFHVHPGFH